MTAQMRQGLAVLCIAAVLALIGQAIGGDGGEVIRAAGILGAALALLVLAVGLLRKS